MEEREIRLAEVEERLLQNIVRNMDKINQNLTIQEQLKLDQMTEREARERSKLNLRNF